MEFMGSYVEASKQPMGIKMQPGKPGVKIQLITAFLSSKLPPELKDSLKIKAAVGNGVYAQVPWIGFFYKPLTTSATKGYYPVILFKADMSGLYLSYILAAGRTRGAGNADALSELRAQAGEFRSKSKEKFPSGFSNEPEMQLKCGRGTVAVGYEAGSIVHKYYPIDELNIEILSEDVNKLVRIYIRQASNENIMESHKKNWLQRRIATSLRRKRLLNISRRNRHWKNTYSQTHNLHNCS